MNNTPTFWWHVAEVVIGIVILSAITFTIVRPTSKTIYTQPVTQQHQFENLKVGFGGCAKFPIIKEVK